MTSKFYHLLALVFIFVSCPFTAFAHDFSAVNEDGVTIYYNKLSDTECEVTYNGTGEEIFYSSGSITIPASVTYDGHILSVTAIGYDAFYLFCGLDSISLPNSITSIGAGAFSCCCNSLTSITIPNSVTYIGSWAFSGCLSLTSITIPNSVTYIGSWAFFRCEKLSSISLESTSITTIGDDTFYDCFSLNSITLPNSITSIGNEAFSSCYALTSITLPNSLSSIGEMAFYYSGLTSIEIPSSVMSIGDWAFEGCSGLTSIEIPSSVTTIGEGAFEGCSGLTKVSIMKETPMAYNYFFYGCDLSQCTLYVPEGSVEAYRNAEGWKDFGTIKAAIPESTDISALDYAIYTPDTEVVGKKQFQLPIYLKNDNLITSWQADLVLPEGFSIATDDFGDPMIAISGSRTTTSRHSVATKTFASGAIRLLYNSQNNIEITGNYGEIATITINIADNVEEEDYAIIFKNIIMAEKNETGHSVDRTVSKVTVKNYLLGDPNNDGKINALDLVALVNYIFENGSPNNIREAADMDGNGEINAIDYVKMVNLILSQPESNAAPVRDAEALAGSLYMTPFAMTAGEINNTMLYLEGATADYTCLQFDLTLPVGISITEAESLSARHALSYQSMNDGSIRFLLSSSANKPIRTEDGIIRLTLQADNTMADGTYYLSTDNALLVTDNADAFSPENHNFSFTVSDPAGISSISLDAPATKAYNLRGQQVHFDAHKMSAGIYVIDGKKVIVE